MSEESERFRTRAHQCRELAKLAKDEYSRDTLTRMAVELEEEVRLIESDEAATTSDRS